MPIIMVGWQWCILLNFEGNVTYNQFEKHFNKDVMYTKTTQILVTFAHVHI
jgi:hypothetical protein